jgi:hypothetical protein
MIRKFILSTILASAGIGLVAVQGCSSSSSNNGASCSSKGSCANDPAPTQAQIDQCTQLSTDPKCGNAFQSVLNCTFANQVCTAAGTTDTTATQAKCQAENQAYVNCQVGGDAAPPVDGPTGDVIGPGGDCSAACAKAANVASCSGISSTCVSTCQNPQGLPANCQSQYNALIHCAATTGSVTGCMGSTIQLSGCDTEQAALVACLAPPPPDGGGDGPVGDGGGCTIGVQGNAACTACISGMCGASCTACSGDPACSMTLLMCLSNCGATDGGTACQMACIAAAPAQAQMEFNDLNTCITNMCVGAGGC